MTTLRVARYLAVASLFTAWGCTTSHFVTNNYGGDDLYGDTESPVKVAQNRQNTSIANNRNGNPDFQYVEGGSAEGADGADYYDDTYLSVRNLRRNVSENVGYGAGFDDGYYAGRNAAGFSPYFASAMWPSLGFASSRYFGMSMGFGSPFRFGYNPWGYSSFGYSPYSSWGDPYWGSGFYSPFYSGMGFGYGGYYGGYSPWNAYPIVVINNGDTRSTRTYGPRGAQSGARAAQSVAGGSNVSPRRGSTAPSANVDASSSSRRGGNSFYGGRSAAGNAAASNGAYYSAPRGGSPNYVNTTPNIRSSASSVNSRSGRSDGGAYYYSQPRSTGRSLSNGSSAGQATRSSYDGGNLGSSRSPSYNNSNSGSRPSAPTYNAPTRSSSTPSYSAPSRSGSSGGSAPSYSAPSRGGGGGSSSRGPR